MEWSWPPDYNRREETSRNPIMEAILLEPAMNGPLARTREITPSLQHVSGQSILCIIAEEKADAAIAKIGGLVRIRKSLSDQMYRWPNDLKLLIPYASQIVLGFSLLEDGKPRLFTRQEQRVLQHIFHDTWDLETYGNFLVIRVNRLPREGWPIAVADMPLFLTTLETQDDIWLGRRGLAPSILSNLRRVIATSFATIASAIHDHFSWSLRVKLVRTVWTGEAISITMSEHCELGNLPDTIAGQPAYYRFGTRTDARQEATFPLFSTKGFTVRDDSSYGRHLCPGVMVSSGNPPEFLSTSGIAVEDETGEKFVTVSSYGFPGNRKDVLHPQGSRADPTASLELKLPRLDIGLVKLHRGLSYTSWPFNFDIAPDGAQPEIAKMVDTPMLSIVQMDSPFVGITQGILVARTIEHGDFKYGDEACVPTAWIWFGNGLTPMFHGVCGAPVMVGNKILGLFRYYDHELELGCVLEAEVLLEQGYKITQIP